MTCAIHHRAILYAKHQVYKLNLYQKCYWYISTDSLFILANREVFIPDTIVLTNGTHVWWCCACVLLNNSKIFQCNIAAIIGSSLLQQSQCILHFYITQCNLRPTCMKMSKIHLSPMYICISLLNFLYFSESIYVKFIYNKMY